MEYFLSNKYKVKSSFMYERRFIEFMIKNKRIPTREDRVRMIVDISHKIMGNKAKYHWQRQRIRKYLSEKYKITDNYIIH